MHFYWRVIEELKFMGETWVIHDPSLSRNYRRWLKINQEAIAMSLSTEPMAARTLFEYRGVTHSLN
jgi:hypothetical protein